MNKLLKVKKSETATIVAKAMKLLASAFSEPYEAVDRQTGEVSVKNSMGFWQDGVLGGVCFQLASKLEYTRTQTLPKAKAAVANAVRNHKGDELSEVQLQRAVQWAQRLIEQEATAEAALYEAKVAYYTAVGKTFEFRARESANRDIVETPAMLAAKALGIGNVNVSSAFNAERPEGRFDPAKQVIERLPDQHGRLKDAVAEQKAKRRVTSASRVGSDGKVHSLGKLTDAVAKQALKRAAEVKAGKLAAHGEAVKRIAAADAAELAKQASAAAVRGSRNRKPSKMAVADMSGDDETIIRDFADLASLLASEGE